MELNSPRSQHFFRINYFINSQLSKAELEALSGHSDPK